MNMALTVHNTLLAFGGVAEAVSVHFFFICQTQSDIALFLNS